MNNEDDTFFEDDEADENLSDEDIAEHEDEEEILEEIVDIAEIRTYEAEPGEKLVNFLKDPWPLPIFIIIFIVNGLTWST